MSREIGALWMPETEADAVRAAYRAARRIVEYGAGGSTIYAATDCQAAFLGIESDPEWRDRIAAEIALRAPDRHELTLRHVDIGPIGDWGMPSRPAAFRKYPGYALSPWVEPVFPEPDLMLIDGRFRLGCFAATVLNATAPLTILWDDYRDRPAYHEAEALLAPTALIGRMARFDVAPRRFSAAEVNRIIPWFSIPL